MKNKNHETFDRKYTKPYLKQIGISIAGIGLTVLGCGMCYKLGHVKGVNLGTDRTFDYILHYSINHAGIVMTNTRDNKDYVFAAKCIDELKQ